MPPLDHDTILKRFNGIQNELAELRKLSAMPLNEFSNGYGYSLAEVRLHHALAGVFNISAHILSRIPGAQATKYSEIALNLGKFGIIDKDFAEITLVKMAKYRNRLVHFYAEITKEELYDIINNHLGDFETFLAAVKKVLESPDKFGFTVE